MYLAFDTETTGLDNECNLLTVCFIILDENLKQLDILNLNIKHEYYKVYTKALEVNGIDLIKHHNLSDTIADANIKLLDFLIMNKMKYNVKRFIPIGHNVAFDCRFIKSNKLLSEIDYNNYISYSTLDTMIIANFLQLSKKIPNMNLSLKNLSEYFCLKESGVAHTAEYDIKITIQLLKVLMNK